MSPSRTVSFVMAPPHQRKKNFPPLPKKTTSSSLASYTLRRPVLPVCVCYCIQCSPTRPRRPPIARPGNSHPATENPSFALLPSLV